MLNTIRQIKFLVDEANRLTDGGKHWTVAFFNRSFVLQVVATIAAVLAVFGVPLPGGADVWAGVWGEAIWGAIFAISQVWALIERLRGKTKAVWNTQQASDALAEALGKAGAPVRK